MDTPNGLGQATCRGLERLARDKGLAARLLRCTRGIEQMSNVKT